MLFFNLRNNPIGTIKYYTCTYIIHLFLWFSFVFSE